MRRSGLGGIKIGLNVVIEWVADVRRMAVVGSRRGTRLR